MNIQKEFDVRNPPFDRPSVVGSKHNSGVHCANPQCSKELLYLREGTSYSNWNRILTISSGPTRAHLR
jgi:hypothetical protein